jgi:hypothetical protein
MFEGPIYIEKDNIKYIYKVVRLLFTFLLAGYPPGFGGHGNRSAKIKFGDAFDRHTPVAHTYFVR